MNCKLIAASAAILFTAVSTQAYVLDTDILTTEPYLSTTWDNPLATLDNVLSGIDDEVGYDVTVSLVDVESWTGWGATSIILEEVAGNRNINTFGWYDLEDTGTLNEIFSGSDNNSTGSATVDFGAETDFGFYLGPREDDTYYSQSSLNTEGDRQLLVFQIQELSNTYLLAWEDLDMSHGSDQDFQDMIVRVQVNVPEPATIGLLGLGVLSLFGARIQQRRKERS